MKTDTQKMLLDEDIKFESLLAMLESPDKENSVVALQIIENLDFKQFALKILLLFKEANLPAEMWKEHAPNKSKKMLSLLTKALRKPGSKRYNGDIDTFMYVSYDDIVKSCAGYEVSNEDTQLLVSLICKKIQESFVGYGLSCIESMDIKINFKPDGK